MNVENEGFDQNICVSNMNKHGNKKANILSFKLFRLLIYDNK